MKHVNTAAERGILECQNQFSDVRWNCSATRERENDDIFGRISKIGKCSRLPLACSGHFNNDFLAHLAALNLYFSS